MTKPSHWVSELARVALPLAFFPLWQRQSPGSRLLFFSLLCYQLDLSSSLFGHCFPRAGFSQSPSEGDAIPGTP